VQAIETFAWNHLWNQIQFVRRLSTERKSTYVLFYFGQWEEYTIKYCHIPMWALRVSKVRKSFLAVYPEGERFALRISFNYSVSHRRLAELALIRPPQQMQFEHRVQLESQVQRSKGSPSSPALRGHLSHPIVGCANCCLKRINELGFGRQSRAA